MSDFCYSCGSSYESLSTHWHRSKDCDHPELTDYENQVITGSLMGDGCIDKTGANPRLQVTMTNKNYLMFLEKELSRICNDVRLHRSAEQLAEQKSSDPNLYNDAYVLSTRTLPDLSEYESWYDSGEKVFPNDLKITPVVFSHWYAGDGSRDRTKSVIHSVNEKQNFSKIDRLFDKSMLPRPDRFGDEKIVWNKESSEKLLSMTPVMPGFEYKWKN